MVFASGLFVFLFLPIVLAVYYLLPRRLRTGWILLASWLFYAWWRPDFLALLAGTSVLTWGLGRLVAARRTDREGGGQPGRRPSIALVIGVVANLGLLAYFKYASFGLDTLNALLRTLGAAEVPALRVVLPVGISFYVFKAISYLVDLRRGTVPEPGGFLEVAVHLALFPQLAAGPIVRYGELARELARPTATFACFSEGALRFMLGLCKKVLVADTLAPLVAAAFGLERPTLVDSWLGVAAYTVQIYFDFAGYSDMAIGIGLMLGLRTPENFRTPYLSASLGEFWGRWHISLSSWLRDYLYIPLGGNRRGTARTCLNLMAVMLLGGLWHGSAWTFVAWGAWHGCLLVFERLAGAPGQRPGVPRPLAVLGTTLAVAAGWVLFRAPRFVDALRVFAGMLGLNGVGLSVDLRWQASGLSLAVLAGAIVATWPGPWLAERFAALPGRWGRLAARAWVLVIPLFLLGLLKVVADSHAPFLYEQF